MTKEYLEALKRIRYNSNKEVVDDFNTIKQALIQAQDLEEQLGCPLEVLSTISKNGFYYDYGYIPPYRISRIDIFNKEIMYYDEEKDCFIVKIENYKKTWWLKEDKSE